MSGKWLSGVTIGGGKGKGVVYLSGSRPSCCPFGAGIEQGGRGTF